jgi:hypothetical protein
MINEISQHKANHERGEPGMMAEARQREDAPHAEIKYMNRKGGAAVAPPRWSMAMAKTWKYPCRVAADALSRANRVRVGKAV